MRRAFAIISGALRREVYEMARSNGTENGERVRAAPLKRPDGMDDLSWSIMRTAKSADVAARVAQIIAGEYNPEPNEAAVLLEVVVGTERRAIQEVIRLRTQLAPKMQAAGAMVEALAMVRERLFRDATRI
jgi:hypothetical protein